MDTPQAEPPNEARFKQAVDFAVSRLAQFEQRDRVIDELVEKFGIDYPEAESLMQFVEDRDKTQVEARQMPLIAILGIATTLAGVALLWAYMEAPLRSLWLLVSGVGMTMGGLVGLLEAAFGLVSGLFRRS